MYVVTVDFTIKSEHSASFLAEIKMNAWTSAAVESGCKRFNVCTDPSDSNRIFLYEVYDDREAFDAHLESPHFKSFDSAVASWVLDKHVRILSLEI